MTTTKILKSLLIAALLASASAYADQRPIQVAMEDGKTVALFKIGDSDCVLIDDEIRCRITK